MWTQCHSYAFDFSVWEIWAALLGGGRLVVVPEDVAGSPDDFHALLVAEQVTVLTQTPVGDHRAAHPTGLGVGGGAARRGSLPGRDGRPVGTRPGADQRLRPHRDHRLRLHEHAAHRGNRGRADRRAGPHRGRCSCSTRGCARSRSGWSANCTSPAHGVGLGYLGRPG